jgi:aspartyl-tRNA(Asn)/glutamyl-tRNA(Gln) amidotransferase subunit A
VRARTTTKGRSGIAGVPIAYKDCCASAACRRRPAREVLEGVPAAVHGDRRAAAARSGLVELGKTNMDEFAMGSSDRELGVRADPQPLGSRARAGRLERGSAAAVAAAWRRCAGHRHRRLDPPARRAVRVVGMKPTYGAVSRYGAVAFASSLDQIGRSRAPCATARSRCA